MWYDNSVPNNPKLYMVMLPAPISVQPDSLPRFIHVIVSRVHAVAPRSWNTARLAAWLTTSAKTTTRLHGMRQGKREVKHMGEGMCRGLRARG